MIIHFSILFSKNGISIRKFYVSTRSNIFKKDIIHDYSFFDLPFQKWHFHSKILCINTIKYL